MKKSITLFLMVLMAVTAAFSQTQRSRGESSIAGGSSDKGADWEVFTFGGVGYDYFKGSTTVDKITTDAHLLGFHWKGNDLIVNDTIYLCNVATGEYMQIGELWGENGMTSHVGIPYKIISGSSTRRPEWGGPLGDMQSDTYWIQPLAVRQERVIGRAARGGGKSGHFEHNRHLFLRTQQEYQGDPTGTSTHPGGFLFKFHPVPYGTNEDTKTFLIYTHRKTEESGMAMEYNNRDSYLLLTSNDSNTTSDLTSVRFKKFAGQMRGKQVIENRGIVLTFKRSTGGSTVNDVSVTIKDMQGKTMPNVTASLLSVDFTTGFTALKTTGAAAITNGSVLAPNEYGNGANDEINFTFRIQGLPTNNKTFDTFSLDVYSMDKNGNRQQRMTRNFQFYVDAGSTEAGLTNYASTGNLNLTSEDVTPDQTGGLYHGIQKLYASSALTAGNDLYIKVKLKKTDTDGCYAGIGSVTLYNSKDSWNSTGLYGDARDKSVGDEVNYREDYVSLENALSIEEKKPENLWKIVTKKQRDRYRLVASDEKPVDVSSRIFNPKFNTSYVYNYSLSQCEKPAGKDYYVRKSSVTRLATQHGWYWFNHDASTHPTEPHVHPWDTNRNSELWGKDKEFHKIGTGRFWRFGDQYGGHDADMQEMNITRGVDANYCGSIYRGTANLQQTIGTGAAGDPPLREGNYIVFVRGFYAPHDMEKYTKSGNTYQFNGSAMGSASTDWKNEALIRVDDDGVPVWRRSHDSYLFAWSKPNGSVLHEVRRMLPSIYEGAMPVDSLGTMSRDAWVANGEYTYTSLNGKDENEINLVKDAHVFGHYTSSFFHGTTTLNKNYQGNFAVPRTVSGAGRFFNATDATTHLQAQNYRIGLPVYVGSDGQLTIGVDHTYAPDGEYASQENEWICFDEFELLYLGANEPEDFFIDELEGQGKVGGYKYINGHTGEEFKEEDKSDDQYDPFYDQFFGEKTSPQVPRRNNTQAADLFNDADIENITKSGYKQITTIKNLFIRRTLTKDGWNSIVLPVPLSGKQVREGFGADTQWSKLDPENPVLGKTLVYKSETDTMYAGQPYIIKPSADPLIPVGDSYERPPFTKISSTTTEGVAGLYFRADKNYYYRNYEIDHTVAGPLYVIEDVTIDAKVVFPKANHTTFDIASNQWPDITGMSKQVTVRGYSSPFTLVETGSYENPDQDGSGTAHLGVPAHSYYLNKGEYRYTNTGFSTTKGLFAYLQLLDNNNVAYSKPFLGGDLYFERFIEDTSGVEEVDYDSTPADGKIEIYDLQGRKVLNPRPGGMYIMNGVKVLWK